MAGKCAYGSSGANSDKMAGPGLPLLSVYKCLVFLVLLAPCVVLGQDRCSPAVINCATDCKEGGGGNYQPQRCHECRCEEGGVSSGGDKLSDRDKLLQLVGEVSELRTLVGVAVGLLVVVVLGMLVGALFCLHHHATPSLPLFLKGKAARAKAKEAQKTDTKIQLDTTAGRIANYQNKHSPLGKRSSFRRPTVSSSPGDVPCDAYGGGRRVRQPSESSSPDDPTTPTTSSPAEHPHAYHNRALSTSTLHDTTASSTSTLAAAVSTNTLDTTLPSGPANTVHSIPVLDNAAATRI